MKLRSTPRDAIDRYEMLFLNDSRECIFRKASPEILVADRKYGPFKKGDRIVLQNWVIEKLLNDDVIEIVPAQAHESLRRLQNVYREEEKHPFKLQPFHPFIYAAMNRKEVAMSISMKAVCPTGLKITGMISRAANVPPSPRT